MGDEIKAKIIPFLKENDVEFAGVFGSVARGTAGADSDLDILVRFSTKKGLLDLVRIERELSERLHATVDLVTQRSLSPHIRESVMSDLQPLYGTV